MKEVVLDLMCELDEPELLDRAQQLSSNLTRYDEVDRERAVQAKHYADLLKEVGGSVRKLSKVIRDKQESRPVTCEVMFHRPVVGVKRVVRTDTGEIVRDEAMNQFEMQNNLFDEPKQVDLPIAESEASA